MFEYDPDKSAANAGKHGIDFDEAKAIWTDERRQTVPFSQETTEPRALVIGRIGDRLWTAIITYRGDKVRVISVRRAREQEIRVYEQQD